MISLGSIHFKSLSYRDFQDITISNARDSAGNIHEQNNNIILSSHFFDDEILNLWLTQPRGLDVVKNNYGNLFKNYIS